MSIAENLLTIKKDIPEEVILVAVSKTKPVADILEAYNAGHRDFGENKIQEMVSKSEELPQDIRWHMIGHVQTNKVKYMAPFVHLVHGCDRVKVLKEVNKQAAKCDRIIDCLIQVHIAEEDTKFGFDESELSDLIDQRTWEDFPNVRLRGMMGMATFTEDHDQIRREFKSLRAHFDRFAERSGLKNWNILSMGMSGDYRLAIEEGSTMVRIGSSIFGTRNP